MRTPQEIAADVLRGRIANPDTSAHGAAIQAAIVEAIEADRAQRYDTHALSDIGAALTDAMDGEPIAALTDAQWDHIARTLAAEGFSRR